MRCALRKRNIERVCNVTMDSSGECQRNREECNDTRRMESNVNREGRGMYRSVHSFVIDFNTTRSMFTQAMSRLGGKVCKGWNMYKISQ